MIIESTLLSLSRKVKKELVALSSHSDGTMLVQREHGGLADQKFLFPTQREALRGHGQNLFGILTRLSLDSA